MRENDNELCGVEPVRMDWVDEMIKSLPVHIEKAILFGSRAVNEHTTWSDYDICFISSEFGGMKPWERMELVLKAWSGNRPLEPICYTPEEFASLDFSLVRDIKEFGRVIYLRTG